MSKLLLIFGLIIIFSFSEKSSQNELIDVSELSSEFEYEIRYATTDNFIGEILYDCSVCLLREEVAAAVKNANDHFCELGYRIKFYDCYRPLDVQKKMWAKVPRATYVANPYDNGSIHNRGAAVDLTLVTIDGCFVDMGSDYDFFGKESHIDNMELSKDVLQNRDLLFKGMKKFGFVPIRTEWWHFSYVKNSSYKILNSPLPCE